MRARMLIVLMLVAWVMPARAQAVCDSVEAPWAESFDTYGSGTELMPPCWVAYRNYDMGYAPHLATAQHRSGTASLALFPGTLPESHYSMVIAPPLRTAALEGLHLKFAFYATSTASHIEVGLCRDTGRYTRAFTPIDTLHASRSGQWQEAVVDLGPHSGLGQRVAFRMRRDMQADAEPVYIDDIRIEACGTSTPWVSHLTSTGLTIHFDAYGEGEVQVAYSDTTIADAHSPLAIVGLAPSTAYRFSIGCAGGERQQVEATTLEGAGYTPAYYQPFDQEPTGWRYLGGGQHSVAGGVLRLASTGADSVLAVLPLQEAVPTRQLTLSLRHRTTGSTRLVVGAMEYGAEAASFQPIDTLPDASGWQTLTLPLASYSGGGQYIALKLTGSGTAELDDLRVARCLLANLRTYNLTSHSVDLSWDTLTSPATAAIRLADTTILPDSNPYTLDGLTPFTPYTLHLHPQCGDDTCAYDRLAFTTFAHEVGVPYCADFEQGDGLPQGWVGGSGVALHGAAHGGTHALSLTDGTVALPLITADTTITLECYLRGSGSLQVGLADNPYAEVEWQHIVGASGAWQPLQLPIVGLAGKVIVLRAQGSIYIDDLSLRRVALAEGGIANTTRTGATLTWQPPIEVEVEYAPVASQGADFEAGQDTTVVATGGSLDLTALQPDSWYAVHLRPHDGCSHLLLHLHTLPPPAALPYCSNFDNLAANTYPSDWRRLSAYGEYPIVSTERNRTGRSLRFSATATAPTLALLPDMEGCGNHLSLAFWHNTTRGAQGAMLVVGHLPDADNLASFQGIDTLRLSATEQWRSHRVDVGTDGTRLALLLVGGTAGETRTFVDDLCLEACATHGITYSVTDTTLALQWDTDGDNALEYQVVGSGLYLTDTATTSPIVVEGLEPSNAYTVRLRTLCECGQAGGTYRADMGSRGTVGADTLHTFSIHTYPPTLSLPWCTHFDNWQTGVMHHYWRSIGNVAVTDRNYASAAHSLLVGGGATLVMPPTWDLSRAIVSLRLYSPDEAALAPGAALLGVMTAPDSAHTFLTIDTLRIGHIGEWERKTVDLSTYGGTGRYLALRTAPGVQLYVDDVALDTAALTAASISAEGSLTWQTLGNVQGVAIAYGAAGQDTLMNDTAYTQPHPLPLTDPDATYEVRLTPLGGCMPLVLTVGRATALPYCEQFDAAPSAGMPQGWTPCRSMGSTPALEAAGEGNRALHLKGNTAVQGMVALPRLQADSLPGLELSLRLRRANANSLLVVGEVDDDADPNTFHPYDTLPPTTPGQWVRVHLPLDRHTATPQRLALACASLSQQAEVWVDNLGIVRGHTPQATAISARQVMLECADSAYHVAIGVEGTPLADAQPLRIDTTRYLLDNLAPSTTYWIYPLYHATPTGCEPPLTVTTPASQPLPYCLADTTLTSLILPEPEADALSDLHLYLTLTGSETVEVGVMPYLGDWDSFLPLDTVHAMPDSLQHVSLAAYDGTARFIALRTLGGGNARLVQLGLTACPRPVATLDNANLLHLSGSGWADLGAGRFHFAADTTIGPMADSSTYQLDLYCSANEEGCLPAVILSTTYTAPLPFCTDSAGGLMPRFGADTLYARYTDPTGHTVHATLPNPTGRPTLPPTVRDLTLDRCPLPDSLQVSQPGNGLVLLGWPDSLGDFYVEYRLQGEPSGTHVQAVRPPLRLTLLPDTLYHLYLHCRTGDTSCLPPQVLHTLATPTALPYCTGFSDVATGELPAGWRVLADRPDNYARIEAAGRLTLRNYNGTTLLVLPQLEVDSLRHIALTLHARLRNSNGHTVQVGTLTDANDASTFDPVESFTSIGGSIQRLFCPLANYYGEGQFVALRLTDDDLLDIDSLSLTTCAAYNFRMVEHEATYVSFEWEQLGTPTVSIEYGERGFAVGSGTTVHPPASPYTLDGITPLTNYTFLLSASCGTDGECAFRSPVDSLFIFSPQGTVGCIDYTDLTASYVSCNTGTYANPTAVQGVVDFGYQSASSRHTVHFDTAERDPRTGGLLRTVPEGAQASVRLGNWGTGGNAEPQAESITYAMTIDPDVADLLILKYAAVLQDPEHAPSLQPRFRLQILDSQGRLIDSCGMADFIANASLGWNQAAGEVLWKDWTTVGLDLTAYAGQSILVRLTTNDCGEGSHFGYAYFTLECASKRMQSEGCSTVPSNRFTVPSGFAYRWYSNQSDSTLSAASSILVPSDNSITYYCTLSFVDKPSCHFTMSAFAGARYPLALFDTALAVADCAFDLTLTNRSTISNDGLTPIGTGEPVERFEWLLPDGSTSTASAPTIHLADTGHYAVQLVAGIAADQCLDTLRRTLHIVYPHPPAHIEAPDRWCSATMAAQATVVDATTYRWAGGSGGLALLTPQADTLLTAYCTDRNGCADTLHHLLHVAPSYHLDEADTQCATVDTYVWHDTTLHLQPDATGTEVYLLPRLTIEGCDSLHTLHLLRTPAFHVYHADTLCHADTLLFFDTVLRTSGQYVHADTTLMGCDSVVSLGLVVRPRSEGTDRLEACDSLRWIDGRLYQHDTVGPQHGLTDSHGCDSTATLHLTLHPSYYHLDRDTLCQGDRLVWRGRTLSDDGFYADTLRSLHQCDSILVLHLKVNRTPIIDIRSDYDCATLVYTLVGETNVPNYRWSSVPHDPLLDSADGIVAQAFPTEPTQYTLEVYYPGSHPCPSQASLRLDPAHLPSATMRATIGGGGTTLTLLDQGTDYADRTWAVNHTPLDDHASYLTLPVPDGADTIWVSMVADDGHCTDTATHLLLVDRSHLDVPNVFTPDAGNNNRFEVRGRSIAQYEIHIYNRHGMLVYHGTSPDTPWDGTDLSGRACPTGSYVYHITYTTLFRPDSRQKKVGTVTLVR